MGVIDDASGKRADEEIWKAIRKLQTMSPLDNSSVEGRVRFIGMRSILVEGSGVVTGYWIIDGGLEGEGTLGWTGLAAFDGPVEITETLDVTAATTLRGATTIENTLDVKAATRLRGMTTLEDDLYVKPAGKIVVEGPFAATLENGELSFATGGKIVAYPQGVAAVAGGAQVVASVAGAYLFFGTNYLAATSAGTFASGGIFDVGGAANVGGRLDVTGAIAGKSNVSAAGSFFNPGITSATATANVYADATGKYFKASSAARFKIDAQPMDLPDALLAVPVKCWIDRGSAERFADVYDAPRPFTEQQQADFDGADLGRIPGVIAEEVEAAGGAAFVGYDADGRIESVAYDRLALARTEILARQLADALAQIADLRNHLAD